MVIRNMVIRKFEVAAATGVAVPTAWPMAVPIRRKERLTELHFGLESPSHNPSCSLIAKLAAASEPAQSSFGDAAATFHLRCPSYHRQGRLSLGLQH